jgi:alpha-tubulin suppressor-like RCC1 family protein
MRVPTIALAAVCTAALAFASCKEKVEPVSVASVEITGNTGPLPIGSEMQLGARTLDDMGNLLNNRAVSWSSDDQLVATVDQSGKVRGVAGGTATIRATSEGKSGTAAILVQFPSPTITSMNPLSVPAQSGAFTLTVTGTNFSVNSVVRWGGADRPTTFVSATTVQAAIPATDLTTPRYVDITVVNPPPGGGTTVARSFAVRLNITGSQIAAGVDHTCAILSLTVYCWGSNLSNELGDGTTQDRLNPALVTGNIPLLMISSYNRTTCGLDVIGAAYCWGANPSGMRGNGGAVGGAGPNPNAVADNKQYRAISVGNQHVCALDLSGAAWCWGDNAEGQLGNGSTTDSNRPVAVSGGLTFTTITTGAAFTCALTAAGVAHCWGNNANGQLGDGTATDRAAPVPVNTPAPLASITAGVSHTCGRTSAGAVYCWGLGGSGQLGRGTNANSSVPVLATGIVSAALDAGQSHTCSVTTGGTVSCWGENEYAQLGVGNTDNRNAPVQLTGLPAIRDIAAGLRHTCAMTTTDQVYCWGSKGRGQLGDGTTAMRVVPTPVTNPTPPFAQVHAGDRFSCGLRINGALACWGLGTGGRLGNGSTSNATSPTAVSSTNSFLMVAVGGSHACGIVSGTNAVNCWGENSSGQVGNGSTAASVLNPVPATGSNQFQILSTGLSHTCGITNNQQLLCWGANGSGQLGIGSNTMATSPTVVTPPPNATFNDVSAGNLHTCASATNGNVYCWGANGVGQLGDGSTTGRNSPVAVSTITGIIDVALGSNHSCGRNSAGVVHCWGANGSGQLGMGQTGNQLTPVPVTGGLFFRSITAGPLVTCGVTNANQAYCWGSNQVGQAGVNDAANNLNSPQLVSGGLLWTVVETSGTHTCGVTSNGAAYCWGLQAVGELGIGQTGVEMVPKRTTGGVFNSPRTRVRHPFLR